MSRYINADKAIKQFKELHGDESNLLNCYNADWIVQFVEPCTRAETLLDFALVAARRWMGRSKK